MNTGLMQTCSPCLAGCDFCNNALTCLVCAPGYYVNPQYQSCTLQMQPAEAAGVAFGAIGSVFGVSALTFAILKAAGKVVFNH